jgi:serine protease Do
LTGEIVMHRIRIFPWGAPEGRPAASPLASFVLAGLVLSTPFVAQAAAESTERAGAAVSSIGPYMPTTLAPVVERALPAVVNISSTKIVRSQVQSPFANDPFFEYFFGRSFGSRVPQERREQSLGSGVIISSDGYVITNNHVIQNGEGSVKVYRGEDAYDAEVIGHDEKTDVALLKIQSKTSLPYLQFSNSDELRVGDFVLAIGNPFGLDRTVTMGIVSAVGRADVGVADYEDFIQTDAAINPGNSGGALLNLDGELVGINTAILSRSGGYQGIGFAIPSNMADGVTKSLREHGEVRRGWIGLGVQDMTEELAATMEDTPASGVLVSDVFEGSPGDRAGLRPGDVIVKVNGRPVVNVGQYRSRTDRLMPGMELELGYRRGKIERTTKLVVEKTPREPAVQRFEEFDSSPIPGLALETLSAKAAQRLGFHPRLRGVLVADVAAGTAGARAGFQSGDVIREVERVAVTSVEDLGKIFAQARGERVLLLVQRGRQASYVAIPNPRL